MCPPACMPTVAARLRDDFAHPTHPSRFPRSSSPSDPARRRFLAGAALSPLAGAAIVPTAFAQRQRVFDLTHTFTPEFPTWTGEPGVEVIQTVNFAESGVNSNDWRVSEHAGTHMDAPIHFSADGLTADEISPQTLIAPLAVVSIYDKTRANPDAQLTPDDLRGWERRHGTIPEGACVAMLSGWGERAGGDGFRNADGDGVMHFPGFHSEAAEMLMTERNVVGIAVDTLSLDHGPSKDFATHYLWLPANRWGLECVANLEQMPPTGGAIFVGSPKVRGATGGQCRVLGVY